MSREDDIKKLITKHRDRLQKLEERKAELGINTPPEVLIEIENIKTEIEKLQTELKATEDVVKPIHQASSVKPKGSRGTPQKTKSPDVQILQTLYTYFDQHPGDPKMLLNELIRDSGVNQTDVLRCLYSLREKGWLNYDLADKAESGLVWLTQPGVRVARDAQGN